jgi:hypothetical protein
MTTIISTHDSPYLQVAFNGHSLADTLRGAADWLDQAEKKLGEVLFVGGSHFELMEGEDEPWQFSLFVYQDEFDAAQPK